MSTSSSNLFKFGDFVIDLAERTLWRRGEPVPLAPKALETLCLLVENHGRLMTKEELVGRLWAETFVEERNLTQNIFTIRKVLGDADEKRLIETVPRRGYRFVADIQPVEGRTFVRVTHHKETRISAEGNVPKNELTDVARSAALGNGTDLEQQHRHNPRKASLVVLATLTVVFCGGGYLIWNSGVFDRGPAVIAQRPETQRLLFERLTESGNAFYPAISPNKEHIAYILNEKGSFSVQLRHRATGSEAVVVEPRKYEIRSPNFSPDGSFLFYGARDGGRETTVYQVPIFGGPHRKIVTNVNHNFTLSPDGEWLAFYRHDPEINGNHLVVCRIDGSEERVVATRKEQSFFRVWGTYPAWSPDGKRIVASVTKNLAFRESGEQGSYFTEVNVEDGSEKPLNAPHWNIAASATWLPHGSGLIVRVQDKPNDYFQLWHLSYPEGEARALTNDTNNYTDFSIASDASFIVASEQKALHNLQLISTADSTEITQLTNSTTIQRGVMGLEWLPNGKEIVYVQLDGIVAGNIWKLNVESLEANQITYDNGAWNRFLSVTPDGGSVVFSSNRTGRWHIWQIDIDGSNLRQMTNGEGESFPQASPDGQWLAYLTPAEKPRILWKQPLAGGEPIKVAENVAGRFQFSPDSREIVGLYYDPNEKARNPWKHVLLPLDGQGTVTDTGFWSQEGIVRWKPDGTGVFYLSTGQSNTNIWLYSVEDQTKRAITNFDSQQIIDLAVSPDGSRFAVARGERASNILQIKGIEP